MAGFAIVAVGVVVLVVAFIALREPGGHVSSGGKTIVVTTSAKPSASSGTSSTPTRSSTSPARSTAGSTSRSQTVTGAKSVPLVVLNNTTVSGLAGQAAQRFRTGGWSITRFGNLAGNISDVISTCAYYDPTSSTARQAAQALQRQYPTIKRVRPKFSQLPAGPVVVVLTPDYTSG